MPSLILMLLGSGTRPGVQTNLATASNRGLRSAANIWTLELAVHQAGSGVPVAGEIAGSGRGGNRVEQVGRPYSRPAAPTPPR
jgi:hypothetical protein